MVEQWISRLSQWLSTRRRPLGDQEPADGQRSPSKPATVEHAALGVFEFDARANRFQRETVWLSHPIKLVLDAETGAALDAAAGAAEALCEDQQAWHERAVEFAVRQLLGKKNDVWLEEGESRLTPQAFKDRIQLREISVDAAGHFEFCYDDGGIFWGHRISVLGSVQEGCGSADIEG